MNQYLALVLASLCLCQPMASEALNRLQENGIKWAGENEQMGEYTVDQTGAGPKSLAAARANSLGALMSQKLNQPIISMEAFVSSAKLALAPLPFVNRDSVAQLIQFTDGLFGSLADITAVVNVIITMANVVLSAFPFGALLPMLFQIVLNLVLGEQTKFYVQYLMFRVWEALPKSGLERLDVRVEGKKVIVVPAGTPTAAPTAPPLIPTIAH